MENIIITGLSDFVGVHKRMNSLRNKCIYLFMYLLIQSPSVSHSLFTFLPVFIFKSNAALNG